MDEYCEVKRINIGKREFVIRTWKEMGLMDDCTALDERRGIKILYCAKAFDLGDEDSVFSAGPVSMLQGGP